MFYYIKETWPVNDFLCFTVPVMNWLGEIGINSEDIAVIFPTHLPLDKKTIYTAVVQINGGRAQLIFGLRGLRNINFKLRDCGEL